MCNKNAPVSSIQVKVAENTVWKFVISQMILLNEGKRCVNTFWHCNAYWFITQDGYK